MRLVNCMIHLDCDNQLGGDGALWQTVTVPQGQVWASGYSRQQAAVGRSSECMEKFADEGHRVHIEDGRRLDAFFLHDDR